MGPPSIGPLEWIIIAVIALMIFGTGRLGEVGGALGKSIREFNRAVRGDDTRPSPEPGTHEDV
jgi:sec-independent protein translocase protein TatA